MTSTRCSLCGATLTWFAGQTWQICWGCGEVTKRVPETLENFRENDDTNGGDR